MAFSLRNVFKPKGKKVARDTRSTRLSAKQVDKAEKIDDVEEEEEHDDEGVESLEAETDAPTAPGLSGEVLEEDGSVIDAIGRVGNQVDAGSDALQKIVREVSSEQSSIIQGIYRLFEERTMTRSDLNKKRQEVWQVLRSSLGEIQEKLSTIDSSGGPSMEAVESLMTEIRQEGKNSSDRVENAIAELRDSQWQRVESMLAELREAEKDRVDKVIGALQEEGEKRIAEVAKSADVRVFDAIRTGDERVSNQKGLLKQRLDDLGAVYDERSARLEADYMRDLEAMRRQKEQAEYRHIDSLKHRKGMLLQMIAVADSVETRIREAQQKVKMREKAREPQPDADALQEGEQRVPFMKRLMGKKKEDERLQAERELFESRLQEAVDEVFEGLRERVQSLEDLLGLMLMTLRQEGVEPFSALGEPFQPERHVRVEDIPAEEGQLPGTVVGVRRRGYMVSGELLRSAEVYVAVAPTN